MDPNSIVRKQMCPQDVLEVKERAEKSNMVSPEGIAASQTVVGWTDPISKEIL